MASLDRWLAPTSRGIERAFAAASPAGFNDDPYAKTMARAIRGEDLPDLGAVGGLSGLGGRLSGAGASLGRLGADRFAPSWGEPIEDRFAATDRALSAKFDFWDTSAPGTPFGGGQQTADPGQQFGQPAPGQANNVGGGWANVDRWNPQINAAAQKWGVDPNRLKAHMRIESNGDPNAVQVNPTYGNTYGLMQINPAIWDATLRANGINMYTPEGNIEAAAYILASQAKTYGGNWDMASSSFFLGNPYWGAQGGVSQDSVNGTTGGKYRQMLNGYMAELGLYGNAGAPSSGGGTASSVIQTALSYVGKVPYVLGGIPGKGQTPTAWDCSGFTYWLNQNYGDGQLVMGSHEQYAQMANRGNLHQMNQMQPGDLMFFNTGASYRGNAASHVGMYIGNGRFVHAANPTAGTIVSNISDYANSFMGAASMSWSGGGAGVPNTVGYGQSGGWPYASTGAYLASLFH